MALGSVLDGSGISFYSPTSQIGSSLGNLATAASLAFNAPDIRERKLAELELARARADAARADAARGTLAAQLDQMKFARELRAQKGLESASSILIDPPQGPTLEGDPLTMPSFGDRYRDAIRTGVGAGADVSKVAGLAGALAGLEGGVAPAVTSSIWDTREGKYDATGDVKFGRDLTLAQQKEAATARENALNRANRVTTAQISSGGQPLYDTVQDNNGQIYTVSKRTGALAPTGVMGQPKAGQSMTETQSKDNYYARSASDAISELDKLAASGYSPGVMGNLGEAANRMTGTTMFTGEERQRFDNAARNLAAIVYRKESGAAVAPAEIEDTKRRYVPLPGDSPEVLAQKRRNQEVLQQSLIEGAGPNSPVYKQTKGATDPGAMVNNRPNQTRPAGNARGAPPVGMVVDGYRFKGGDPNNRASWERAS